MNIPPALWQPASPVLRVRGCRRVRREDRRRNGALCDEKFDTGPNIIQASRPLIRATPGGPRQRILEQEQRLYPQAIHFTQGRLEIEGRRVTLRDAVALATTAHIVSPPIDGDF